MIWFLTSPSLTNEALSNHMTTIMVRVLLSPVYRTFRQYALTTTFALIDSSSKLSIHDTPFLSVMLQGLFSLVSEICGSLR